MIFVYCAGANLHLLVNNNTLTQLGSCIVKKRLVNLFIWMYNINKLTTNHGVCITGSSIIMLIMQTADFA